MTVARLGMLNYTIIWSYGYEDVCHLKLFTGLLGALVQVVS